MDRGRKSNQLVLPHVATSNNYFEALDWQSMYGARNNRQNSHGSW